LVINLYLLVFLHQSNVQQTDTDRAVVGIESGLSQREGIGDIGADDWKFPE
jgi:hypothetical protein